MTTSGHATALLKFYIEKYKLVFNGKPLKSGNIVISGSAHLSNGYHEAYSDTGCL